MLSTAVCALTRITRFTRFTKSAYSHRSRFGGISQVSLCFQRIANGRGRAFQALAVDVMSEKKLREKGE
jgi:hypothetical protein